MFYEETYFYYVQLMGLILNVNTFFMYVLFLQPMTFPLKKMAKRCRLCRKNGLRFPIDKISEVPCQ